VEKLLAEFSVKKPYTIIVGIIIILILGAISVYNTTTDLLPNINLPIAVIITAYPGASPETIEMSVSQPIEQVMLTLSDIQNVYSFSSENVSMVMLEFSEMRDMDAAVVEIREKLDLITAYLPKDTTSPMIMRINPNLLPVAVLSVAVRGQSVAEASKFIEDTVIPEYQKILGVASVSATGLSQKEIHVTLNQSKIDQQKAKLEQIVQSALFLPNLFMPKMDLTTMLQQYGLDLSQLQNIEVTPELISAILQGQNISMPAGYLQVHDTTYLVRVGDRIRSIEELQHLPLVSLPIPNLKPITLADVADIELINNTGKTYTRFNGEEAVMLIIQKQTDYSTAEIARKIRERTKTLNNKYPDLQVTSLFDQGIYIDMVIDSIVSNIIYGGILAVLTLILFLRSFRPTLVVAVSIPISIVTTFVLMYFSKITLNIISLGGLALGVGMLVDNSIVVIENIYRLRSEGKSAKEAAVAGAKQVAGAITASTLTTIAVFLPIVFTQGLTRQIFSDMGLTITYSLTASLLVALTFVPMMASRSLGTKIPTENRFTERLKTRYSRILQWSLNHRAAVLVGVVILFAVSCFGMWQMGTEFIPTADTGQIMMQVTLPSDATFADAIASADEITAILRTIDDIDTIGVSLGSPLSSIGLSIGKSEENTLSFYLLLKEKRQRTSMAIAEEIRQRTSNVNAEITVSESSLDLSILSGGDIAINIRGPELDTLQRIARDVAVIVAETEGTIEVSDGLEDTAPEFRITVDKQKSIAKGLTVGQVLLTVNQRLGSNKAATTLTIGTDDYAVYVKDDPSKNQLSVETLKDIQIESPLGESVLLGDIATIETAEGFTSIMRQNHQRTVTVTGSVADGYNVGIVSREIDRKLQHYQLPEGYSIDYSGELLLIQESFDDLFLVLVVGVILIYLVMVAEFQSLFSPFIVMFTIPLGFTGGFLGLIFAGYPLSIVAFIGLIVLAGVVVNNGIVLIDYINNLRRDGLTKREAIVQACVIRLRPILMTALTTILGLSTMSLGVGVGTELIQPMAISASCGLTYATALTLLVVPILYDLFNREKA